MTTNITSIQRLTVRQKAGVVATCIGIMRAMSPHVKTPAQAARYDQRMAKLRAQYDALSERADRLEGNHA